MEKFPLIPSLFPNVPPSIRFIPLEEDYEPPFPEVFKLNERVILERNIDIETNKQFFPMQKISAKACY